MRSPTKRRTCRIPRRQDKVNVLTGASANENVAVIEVTSNRRNGPRGAGFSLPCNLSQERAKLRPTMAIADRRLNIVIAPPDSPRNTTVSFGPRMLNESDNKRITCAPPDHQRDARRQTGENNSPRLREFYAGLRDKRKARNNWVSLRHGLCGYGRYDTGPSRRRSFVRSRRSLRASFQNTAMAFSPIRVARTHFRPLRTSCKTRGHCGRC